MEKQEVQLQVTIEEANLLLEALGNLPFKQVYALIRKIQQQAAQQIQPENGEAIVAESADKTEQG